MESNSFDRWAAQIRRYNAGVSADISIFERDVEEFADPDFYFREFETYTENFTSTCNCSECETYRERRVTTARRVTVTATQVADLDLYEKFGSSFDYFFREVRR